MDSEALALRLGNYEGGDAVARHYHGKSGAETINRGFGDALARFEGHLSPLVARSLGRVVVAVDSDGGGNGLNRILVDEHQAQTAVATLHRVDRQAVQRGSGCDQATTPLDRLMKEFEAEVGRLRLVV